MLACAFGSFTEHSGFEVHHAVARVGTLFLFVFEWCCIKWLDHSLYTVLVHPPRDGLWIVSSLTIKNKAAGSICIQEMCFHVFGSWFLEVELLGPVISLRVNFLKSIQCRESGSPGGEFPFFPPGGGPREVGKVSPTLAGMVTQFRSQQDGAITFSLARLSAPAVSWKWHTPARLLIAKHFPKWFLGCSLLLVSSAGAPVSGVSADASWDLPLWAGSCSSTSIALHVGQPCLPTSYRNPPPPNSRQIAFFFAFAFISHFPILLTEVIFWSFQWKFGNGSITPWGKAAWNSRWFFLLGSLSASPVLPLAFTLPFFLSPRTAPAYPQRMCSDFMVPVTSWLTAFKPYWSLSFPECFLFYSFPDNESLISAALVSNCKLCMHCGISRNCQ